MHNQIHTSMYVQTIPPVNLANPMAMANFQSTISYQQPQRVQPDLYANNPMPAISNENKTLWMGDILQGWNEAAIHDIFNRIGTKIENLKLVNDPTNNVKKSGYAFVRFHSAEIARMLMLEINGTDIPGMDPPIRFNLSFANSNSQPQKEFNLLVSDLPPNFTDAELFRLFGRKYISCRGAKILRHEDGSSKCMGFIRFSDENEQTRAYIEMKEHRIGNHIINLKVPGLNRGNGRNHDRHYNNSRDDDRNRINDRKRPAKYDKHFGIEDKRFHVSFDKGKVEGIRQFDDYDSRMANAKMNSLDSFFVEKRLRLRFTHDYFQLCDEENEGEDQTSDTDKEKEVKDELNEDSDVPNVDSLKNEVDIDDSL
uniref:RNA-binding domain-containing protein n=1 Tax=Rhabditophanes sp. KR3021 TaxID=114890 RepID=A0AC35TN08_9BILA